MQSRAATVEDYLAALPEDRRLALNVLRRTILDNLDAEYEEGMQYGMIGYYVPHRVFPAGYHCDPRQPLPFAGLASQKNHMSLYFMAMYEGGELERWFRAAWEKTGRKLDMGKCCVRFKKIEDVPLELIGEVVKRMPAKKYIRHYQDSLSATKAARAARKPAANKTAAKPSRSAKRVAATKPKAAGTKAQAAVKSARATSAKKKAPVAKTNRRVANSARRAGKSTRS